MHTRTLPTFPLPLTLTLTAAILAAAGCSTGDSDAQCDGAKCDDGDQTGITDCWAGDEPMWNRDGGEQLALVEHDPDSGMRRLLLSFGSDGALCRLTGGRDDYAPAFAPGGRVYGFLSNRNGPTDLFVVDMDELDGSGAPTARAQALGCAGDSTQLADIAPALTGDGRLLYASRATEGPWVISSVPALEGGCGDGFIAVELPVVPTAVDLLRVDNVLFGTPETAAQAEYDQAVLADLDRSMAEHGTLDGDDRNDVRALSYRSLRELDADPASSVGQLRSTIRARVDAGETDPERVSYFDRLSEALALYEYEGHVTGIALDPNRSRSSIAVATGLTGVTKYDSIGNDPRVGLRIAPADVDAGLFGVGLAWQGPRIAFTVQDFPYPRVLIWDGSRNLTDQQIDALLADAAQPWGPLGLRRVAGGLVIDRDLEGEAPALGPNGGRGASLDGERVSFSRLTQAPAPTCSNQITGQLAASLCPSDLADPDIACVDHRGRPMSTGQAGRWCPNTDAPPPAESRVVSGNHWDVRGPEGIGAVAERVDREQTGAAFRP